MVQTVPSIVNQDRVSRYIAKKRIVIEHNHNLYLHNTPNSPHHDWFGALVVAGVAGDVFDEFGEFFGALGVMNR